MSPRSKHRPKFVTALSLGFAVLGLLAGARTLAGETRAMHFDRLTVEDGLAQNSVMAMAQDDAGFIWFATESGLNRFDGVAFRHYQHERGNSNTLSADFVRDLDVAADGTLWIGTDGGGVSAWDPATDAMRSFRHDPADPGTLGSDKIRAILADEPGTVWVGTRDAGLDRIDVQTDRITHYTHAPGNPASLSNSDVFAIERDPDGKLWIGTKSGLNRLNPSTGAIERIGAPSAGQRALPDQHILSLHVDSQGALWVGTESAGLLRLDRETLTFERFAHSAGHSHGLSSDKVEAVYEDRRGRLWVGTDKGLNLRIPGTDEFHAHRSDPDDPTTLGADGIFSIFEDRSGLLWVGTRTGGVSKWNPRSWSFGHFRPDGSGPNAFSNPNVTSFVKGPDESIWVGTFGGGINVVSPDRNRVRQVRHDPDVPASLPDDRVMTLTRAPRGNVWVGTMTGGLAEIGPSGTLLRNFRHDPADPGSIAANGIMSLLFDASGNLWIGTFGGGVSRLDPATGQVLNFPHVPEDPATLSSPRATALAQDQGGTIWVGTDGGGLNYQDPRDGSWLLLRHDAENPDSLSANTIYALHIDSRGRLWAGTRAGLDRVSTVTSSTDPAVQPVVAPVEAVPRTAIYGIQSDTNGFLWLSTSQGLVQYSPETGNTRRYRRSHGLQGDEFNSGASYSDPDGRLYFGGSNGFNAFKPNELERNETPPPIALTALTIMNQPVQTDVPYDRINSIDLGYSDDVVTIDIAALDFTSPEHNLIAYQLEGFDKQWVDAGSNRRITYTNLDGGDYTLKVRAANSDGVWNADGLSIPVLVAPPPWQTWWAYSLYALCILASVGLAWRHHDQKLKREHQYSRRLEVEVSQRTQELFERNRDLNDANKKLREASTTDVLTGLRNRRYLFEQISKDVELVLRHYRDGTETLRPDGNNDLLFLMVDLDNFKPVNDSCGHEAGDRLLIQIRDVLLDVCRRSDDVIRWGGDEFLVIARETNRKHAANLAERIRASLSARVFPVGDGQVARITTSIGYASYPFIKDRPELLDWEEVLGVADAAMYEAKERRNAWVGIEGVEWDGSGQELFQHIKAAPGALAESGAIRAIESLDDVDEASA